MGADDSAENSGVAHAGGSKPPEAMQPPRENSKIYEPISIKEMDSIVQRVDNSTVKWKIGEYARSPFTHALRNIIVSSDYTLTINNFVKTKNVTHVVTCCSSMELPPQFSGCKRLEIAAIDVPCYPILQHLAELRSFLDSMDREASCLIHCRMGINRSVALALAIMIRQRITRAVKANQYAELGDARKVYATALQELSESRGVLVLTNPGFQRQLVMYTHLLMKSSHRAVWPTEWGPELWMPLAKVKEDGYIEKVKRFRRAIESASRDFGKDNAGALGLASKLISDEFLRANVQTLPMPKRKADLNGTESLR